MKPLIRDKYALLLPLAVFILADENGKANELLRAPIAKTAKPKKPLGKID
jgi:hypothetical protein